jgi:hypothetical protein
MQHKSVSSTVRVCVCVCVCVNSSASLLKPLSVTAGSYKSLNTLATARYDSIKLLNGTE